MAEPLQVFLHYNKVSSCNYFRLLLPARYCQPHLPDLRLVTGRDLTDKNPYDALMIHGMPSPLAPTKYSKWLSQGKKIICCLDDDYSNLPDYNPVKHIFTEDQHAAYYWVKHGGVSALNLSTQPLSDAMPRRPSGAPFVQKFVCPNLIEPSMYRVDPKYRQGRNDVIRILWCGSNTHRGDLEEITESVTDILEKYGQRAEFIFWGDMDPEVRRRHGMRGVMEYDGGSLHDYYVSVCRIAPDIWLCPLADNAFGVSKSSLKVLEGWALGAAVVASPTLPYSSIIRHGENGLLARTQAEWTDALSRLIEDEKFRLAVAANGTQTVHEKFSWENPNCPGFEPWLRFFNAIPRL